MANTNLTIDMIAAEMTRFVYQNLKFIGNINRQWEGEFGKDNAKIGDSVRVRIPQKWNVRTGVTMNPQDVEARYVTLGSFTRKHVAFQYTMDELDLSIDEFVKKNNLKSLAATLAADVEADVLSTVYKQVNNFAGSSAAAVGVNTIFEAEEYLNDQMAPEDNGRTLLLSNKHNRLLITDAKALYNPSKQLANQYIDGYQGDIASFSTYTTSLLPRHTTGSYVSSTAKEVNGATESGSTITVANSTGTFAVGDIIQFEGVYAVHPLTKVNTGRLFNFSVTEALAAGGTTLKITPSLEATGQYQNVSNVPANGADVYKYQSDHSTAQTASKAYSQSLAFHRDAFAFASVPIQVPATLMGSTASFDGLNLRVVTFGDGTNDINATRVDIRYACKTVLPELACRIIGS